VKAGLIGFYIIAACTLSIFISSVSAEDNIKEQSKSVNECQGILVNKCSDCHHLTRICQKLGKKSKGDWRRSIKRMIRKGTVLSKEEQKLLVQCLHKQQEGAKKACQK
jgi:hypothetical protein